jgi:hypothetical protein
MVSIALPSAEVNGPAIWPRMAPVTPPKRAASAAAFALSAAVTPDGRSYTTTAGYTLGETASDRRFRTSVDSAFAGSQAEVSFFSAPVSFPDSGPATATMISQPTSTSHLARRPADAVAIPRRKLTSGPPVTFPPCHQVGRRRAPGIIGIKPADILSAVTTPGVRDRQQHQRASRSDPSAYNSSPHAPGTSEFSVKGI